MIAANGVTFHPRHYEALTSMEAATTVGARNTHSAELSYKFLNWDSHLVPRKEEQNSRDAYTYAC